MYDNKIFSNQHCFKYSTETDFISVHILQDLKIHQKNWLSNLKLFNKSLACLLLVKLVVLVGLWFVLSLIASKLFVIGIAHLILDRSSVKHFSLMTIKMHFIVKSRNYVIKSFMNLLICKSCYCNIETVHIHTSKYIRRICKYNTCCSLVLIS